VDAVIRDFLASARAVVRDACPLLQEAARAAGRPATHKADGSLVTESDRAVEALLSERFHRDLPAIPILGEEGVCLDAIQGPEDARRHYEAFMRNAYHIVIDPIDGTRNFVEGRPQFCVAACLTRRVDGGLWPVVGVVAIPLEGVMYWCDDESVWREDIESGAVERVVYQPSTQRCVSVSSKDRMWLAKNNYDVICPWISSGSSVHDFIGTALGGLSGSILGSQRLWDLLAPLAIASRLGMVLRDLVTGEDLRAITPDDLSVDFERRPWGLMRRMVLLPKDRSASDLVRRASR